MDSYRLLIDAVPEKIFYLSNGKPIRNLSELVSELEVMSQDDFAHHCNNDKDDFALWIEDALRMEELAILLRNVKDKDEYIKVIKSGKISHKDDVAEHTTPRKDAPAKQVLKKEDKKEDRKVEKNDAPIELNVTKSVSEKYAKDVDKIRTTIDGVYKLNSELIKKVEVVERANAELNKKLDSVTKINSELSKNVDYANKTNYELGKKVDNIDKAHSDIVKKVDNIDKMHLDVVKKVDIIDKTNIDISKKTDILGKAVAESPIPEMVSKHVARYFENKEFRDRMVEVFKQTIADLHLKYRNTLKAEMDNVIALNAQLEKKMELSLQNRAKQTEKVAQSTVTDVLNARLVDIGNKMDKMLASRASKMEQSFDKKAQNIYSAKLAQFKTDAGMEKSNLRSIAAEAMNKEFEKIFSDDAHVSAIVSKYQKMFTEGLEHSVKMQKEYESKLKDEMTVIKDKFIIESHTTLNRQLSDTVRRQREILDSELAKALSSNKYFVSRFEKEVVDREKLLLESADRKLKENYNQHDSMLGAEFTKYYRELSDLKLQSEKDFKAREAQFTESINSKIHESMNKEFDDVLMNQRKELSETISTVRLNAINKIDIEFSEILSKHKHFLVDQFNKAATDQNSLKDKFIAELKSEEDKMLVKVKDMMQKELSVTMTNQRNLLDQELTKTVLANKYFVERFEKEVIDLNNKITVAGSKMLDENYAKHDKAIRESYAKQFGSLGKMITEADANITNKESKILTNLNATIPSSVREAVNKEFSRLILDEKKALEAELVKAEQTNKNIEKRFETELGEKARKMVDTFSKDFNTKFGELMTSQQVKLDAELVKAKKSYEIIEGKKNEVLSKAGSLIDNVNKDATIKLGELMASHQAKLDAELVKAKKAFEAMETKKDEMIAKTNSFLDDMSAYSSDKLKELEREHDKHLKKVSQISVLISKVEDALEDLKEMKAQVNSDKKNVSKENKEYSKLMTELNDLRTNLSQEKRWIALYREKVNIYNMIRQCSEYIRLKDAHNARLLYNKIAKAYSDTPFEESDKVELYNAATLLLKETQRTFPEEKNLNK